MSEPITPRAPATVADLHHTPVTLGVVLTVQAVALGAVLLVAGVLWSQVGELDHKLDAVGRDVGKVREDLAEIKALLQAPRP